MLDLKMKDICRICGRELCGNQRKWIFHTTAKLNLQVVLSHVLGKELLRDGQAEFACSKCAFMLERFYRYDTVIARIEALSIERLQKLHAEKVRLKHCLASLYRKNNENGKETKSGQESVEALEHIDVQYSYTALLQEDFAYSGFECWTEFEDYNQEVPPCLHSDGAGSALRKCHGCSSLKVADSDYEAVCKVPRKIAQNVSCGHFSMCINASSDQIISQTSEYDGDGLEKMPSGQSVDFGSASKDLVHGLGKTEEQIKPSTEHPKSNYVLGGCGCSVVYGRKLDRVLNLVKMFDYRPVQVPRGSRIPVKCCSVLKSVSSNTGYGLLDTILESPSNVVQEFLPDVNDLSDLWINVYEEYYPLGVQTLIEKHSQEATQYNILLNQQCSKQQKAEMEAQNLQEKLQESEDFIKTLQENQHQLTAKLNSVQELVHNQENIIQSLSETLQSRDREVAELYQVIDDNNNTIAKLQDLLLKTQREQVQPFSAIPTQVDLLELQNALFSTQLELQKKQIMVQQRDHQLNDAKRSLQLLEVELLEVQQHKETTWKHNQDLHGTLHKLQRELQDKIQHHKNLDNEKLLVQEHTIQRLNQTLSQKEMMLQEYKDSLCYQQSLGNNPGHDQQMLEKLRQRIKDRDSALEQAVDDKFCALEEKEKEMQQLKMIIRDREHDLERMSNIIAGNEETINSLDNLVKAKDLEVELISAAYKNLQWLKNESEEKYNCSLNEKVSIIRRLHTNFQEGNKDIEAFTQCHQVHPLSICMKSEDVAAKGKENETVENLKCDLVKAKEDLRLVLRKMREYRLEVSALQSIIMKQNEQLREQAADIDTLTRTIQIKEELIKDLQIKLVDPEDIPTVELLTQQIFTLNEKIATMDLASQGKSSTTQKLFKLLEELAANKSRLNDALQSEKQLYSCLIQFHSEIDSHGPSAELHSELLAVQTLRSQLEDALLRTMEQLVALQSQSFGGGGKDCLSFHQHGL